MIKNKKKHKDCLIAGVIDFGRKMNTNHILPNGPQTIYSKKIRTIELWN